MIYHTPSPYHSEVDLIVVGAMTQHLILFIIIIINRNHQMHQVALVLIRVVLALGLEQNLPLLNNNTRPANLSCTRVS